MSREQEERSLSTADFVAAGEMPAAQRTTQPPTEEQRMAQTSADVQAHEEQLAALFTPEVAGDFQSRWDAVQIGFVDDPGAAVRKADELVAQVMKSLAQSFASERARFEGQLDQRDSASTENMRVALRRYRSFFQRLLSL